MEILFCIERKCVGCRVERSDWASAQMGGLGRNISIVFPVNVFCFQKFLQKNTRYWGCSYSVEYLTTIHENSVFHPQHDAQWVWAYCTVVRHAGTHLLSQNSGGQGRRVCRPISSYTIASLGLSWAMWISVSTKHSVVGLCLDNWFPVLQYYSVFNMWKVHHWFLQGVLGTWPSHLIVWWSML